MFETSATRTASSVSTYLAQVNQLLATQYGRVKGELISFKPSGKAIYFTIKDKDRPAVLECMMWLSIYQANGLKLAPGDDIIVSGSPDIYAPYGKFSFKASTIEYAGEGELKKAYDRLKATLEVEGLLSHVRKRPMPDFPKNIGIITSMSGVVIQDFSANLKRHGFRMKTIDSRVEGKDAIHDLLAAMRTIDKQDIDVLVIMRGGGSWESLQAFNTESVVRAIARSRVPVLTGIGHDVDVTLAEMVADIGRSTPTAVAEALNEPWDGLQGAFDLLYARTIGAFRASLAENERVIDTSTHNVFRTYERQLSRTHGNVTNAATSIFSTFSMLARRVREAHGALLRSSGIMKSNIGMKRRYLEQLPRTLRRQTQLYTLTTRKAIASNLGSIIKKQSDIFREGVRSLADVERTIALNDPKRNLRLGYSLSYIHGKLARTIADVSVGAHLTTHLVDGEFTSEVKEVE